jgi:glycosyltransferase involved in cell wall biosynthesis
MKKKILVVHLESLFPKVMASQDTVFKMVKRLSQDHVVDIATTVRNDIELSESRKNFAGICNAFHPIVPINPENSQLRRKLSGLQFLLHERAFGHPYHYFYAGRNSVMSQLARIVRHNHYDIVQAEYWYMAQLFDRIPSDIIKVVDTHDVLFDKKRQELGQRYEGAPPAGKLKALQKYRALELACLRRADLLLAISAPDQKVFTDLGFGERTMLVTVGQDLEYFQDSSGGHKDNVVVFYGSMGGNENIAAFSRFWDHIWPLITREVPSARLLVVGANPPEFIRRLHDGRTVTVTGFVDDVRPHLSRAKASVIPLDVAAGFRSRTVELMAMGIPVVGTHKALDCVEITHGRHGFVTDSNLEMARHTVQLLVGDELRKRMSEACREFTVARYSIEATIGKLSSYYQGVEKTPWRPASLQRHSQRS